jgi:hypothetical protein
MTDCRSGFSRDRKRVSPECVDATVRESPRSYACSELARSSLSGRR